jgi:hypothetical protein
MLCPHRQNLVRWQCYFWQQRADANVIKDNELNAINSLEQGMKVATEHQLLDQQVGDAWSGAAAVKLNLVQRHVLLLQRLES